MGSLARDSASSSQGRRRSRHSGTPSARGWVIRVFHSWALDQEEEGSCNPGSCNHLWKVSWSHSRASDTSGRFHFSTTGNRPFHAWGSKQPSPVSEHLSCSYSCTSFVERGGGSDTEHPGPITGSLNSCWFFCAFWSISIIMVLVHYLLLVRFVYV